MKKFLLAVIGLVMLSSTAALATHSPTGDQTPGRDHVWTERPFYGTNEPPLGHSNIWVTGLAANGILGPFTSVRLLDLGNGSTDVSGEGTFGGFEGRRVISVIYNNPTCDLRADRSGHIAHVEWVQAHPAVGDTFRHIGLNVNTKGYSVNATIGAIQSFSVRVFAPGADFPETEGNTTKVACYNLVEGRTLQI